MKYQHQISIGGNLLDEIIALYNLAADRKDGPDGNDYSALRSYTGAALGVMLAARRLCWAGYVTIETARKIDAVYNNIWQLRKEAYEYVHNTGSGGAARALSAYGA
jgi:hypothetical protein